MIYDYIIVGGGPSGSTAAFCFQKQGAKCLIVDQKSENSEKTCGGLLTWSGVSALQNIGLEPKELLEMGAANIQKFVYFRNDDSIIHKYHVGEYGVGITRKLLDQWLLDYAVSVGAEYMPAVHFRRIMFQNNLFQVENNFGINLIIATGANGYVPMDIDTEIKNQTFGISAQIMGQTALSQDAVNFFITGENEYDYFWIIPNGNNIWNIGIWFQKTPQDAVAQFWKYKKFIVDERFKEIQFVRSIRGAFCGNIDFSKHYPPGCYAVGDAAGLNKSNTGEGLRYAIESAIMLSKQIKITREHVMDENGNSKGMTGDF